MTFRFGKHKTAILLISRTLRVVLRLKISIIGLLVVFVRRSLRSGLMLINFNKLLNKWTKTINVSCLSPLIELTNHMRSHSVWLSTAPKLEKCITCTGICFIQKTYAPSFSPSPLRLNMFRLFVILSLTQLYRYTPEIFLFSTATFKHTYPPSDELDKNSQRTWLIKNFSHWNGYSHMDFSYAFGIL